MNASEATFHWQLYRSDYYKKLKYNEMYGFLKCCQSVKAITAWDVDFSSRSRRYLLLYNSSITIILRYKRYLIYIPCHWDFFCAHWKNISRFVLIFIFPVQQGLKSRQWIEAAQQRWKVKLLGVFFVSSSLLEKPNTAVMLLILFCRWQTWAQGPEKQPSHQIQAAVIQQA